MYRLRKLQFAFAEALFSAGRSGVNQHVRANGLDPARRVQVYRNNMFVSLGAALEAVYPVVRRLVGDHYFSFASKEYVRDHPSLCGDLHAYGDRFADFLAALPTASGLPYLPDVARLEWCYHQVFHTAPDVSLDLEGLQALPAVHWERLGFSLNPAGRLLASRYPILRIWQVNQEDYAGNQRVDLAEGAARVLVLGRDLDVRIYALSPGEFAWLQALAEGDDITGAYERACVTEPDLNLDACLKRHITRGTLVDWYLARLGESPRSQLASYFRR
jgi:hypothetical protein